MVYDLGMREHKSTLKTQGEVEFALGLFMPRQSDVLAKYIRDGGYFFRHKSD